MINEFMLETRRSVYTHTRNVMNDQRVHAGNTSFSIHTFNFIRYETGLLKFDN